MSELEGVDSEYLFDLDPDDEAAAEILTVPLAIRFGWPPFSFLDRRQGEWTRRKRKWKDLGIDSGEGHGDELLGKGLKKITHGGGYYGFETLPATSIFDPALCELMINWFSAPGYRILDPFAGGSVRGIVASRLGRPYTGVDLSREQVEANRKQAHIADPLCAPHWIMGDSADVLPMMAEASFDMIMTCPPYADLEKYTDDPKDLSNLPYDEFLATYGAIICEAVDRLKPNRFAAWVISDVRDKATGHYRGLVSETISAFQGAGVGLYNDIVIVDPVGTNAVRSARPFDGSRKVARLHQHLLVFVKGDGKAAAREFNEVIEAAEQPLGNGDLPLF